MYLNYKNLNKSLADCLGSKPIHSLLCLRPWLCTPTQGCKADCVLTVYEY